MNFCTRFGHIITTFCTLTPVQKRPHRARRPRLSFACPPPALPRCLWAVRRPPTACTGLGCFLLLDTAEHLLHARGSGDVHRRHGRSGGLRQVVAAAAFGRTHQPALSTSAVQAAASAHRCGHALAFCALGAPRARVRARETACVQASIRLALSERSIDAQRDPGHAARSPAA